VLNIGTLNNQINKNDPAILEACLGFFLVTKWGIYLESMQLVLTNLTTLKRDV